VNINDPSFRKLDLSLKSERRYDFEHTLKSNVTGQDKAIDSLSQTYEVILSGLVNPRRPFSNTLFLGPTGVGKTLTVESVAEAIHGHPDFMFKIHCSEYSEDHQIARLIGAPPGYVGHDNTEPLLSAKSLMKGWTENGKKISVVLFDEIEKASPRLWQLLLGIMDKAELFDGRNQRVDMSRCWIFMTSNIGSRAINQDHIGLFHSDDKDALANEATSAAKRRFDPEFMGRIDTTITFNKLSRENYDKILTMELSRIWNRVLSASSPSLTGKPANLITMALTDKFNDWLIDRGTDEKHGARGIRRLVETKILNPLATILVTEQIKKPSVIVFDIDRTDVVSAHYCEQEEGKIVLTDVLEETEERQIEVTNINTPGKYTSDGTGPVHTEPS